MRWMKVISAILVAVGFGSFVWLPTVQAGAIITEPPSGALIENRKDFPIA